MRMDPTEERRKAGKDVMDAYQELCDAMDLYASDEEDV